LISDFAKADMAAKLTGRGSPQATRTRGEGVFVRAGNSSRPAGERKRRILALPEDSSAADPPRPVDPLTPAKKAARVTNRKESLNGKSPTFHAHARGQEGSRP
jgi:hypothetical protein